MNNMKPTTLLVCVDRSINSLCCVVAFVVTWFSLVAIVFAQDKSHSHVAFQRVELGESQWTNGFWADRQRIVESASLPQMWQIMTDDKNSQFLTNFLIASGDREGKHRGPAWNDGDFYKWIEAASTTLATKPDAQLEQRIDQAIAAIGKAQRDDGYVHTPVQIRKRQGDSTAIPFSEPLQFELYNLGHLMSAGCVHCRATGKKSLLNIAIAAADFLDRTFNGPDAPLGRSAICPSHYMGLIDLGRFVNSPRYIRLAQKMIERRNEVVDGTDDNQDRIPFRQQKTAVGHAVRANYLYAGVADLVAETGDETLLDTLKTIWDDVVQSKLYITGACGALFDGASPDGSASQKTISRIHQAYGRAYQLPNSTAHNESCATIGNILWNWRMLELTGEAKYADVMEQSLYNGLLATISLDGSSYFYTNTLRQLDKMPTELRWSRERKPFISCYCCPPNIIRTIAQSQLYAYGKSKDAVWVHLYGSSQLRTKNDRGESIALQQVTEYPNNGQIRIRIQESPERVWSLKMRIPQWAKGATLKVNNVATAAEIIPGKYVALTQSWKSGDQIELSLPMQVRVLESHPLVEENRNQVSVLRGPIVYCLESKDLPVNATLLNSAISFDAAFETATVEALPGVVGLQTQVAFRTEASWEGGLYRERDRKPPTQATAKLIPYYAWGNRGASEMSVWIPIR